MDKERFYDIIDEAVPLLPAEFIESIDNIEIIVQDYPDGEMRKYAGRGNMLLGLYVGIPRTARGSGYSGGLYNLVPPDRIYLFKKNIEESCRFSGKPLVEEIKETLFHEIGHYLGLSEEELKDLKYKKMK